MTMAEIFSLVTKIYSWQNGQTKIAVLNEETFQLLKNKFPVLVENILGLKNEESKDDSTDSLVKLFISLRKEAKEKKDFATSDKIRNDLAAAGIKLNDNKDGTTSWERE